MKRSGVALLIGMLCIAAAAPLRAVAAHSGPSMPDVVVRQADTDIPDDYPEELRGGGGFSLFRRRDDKKKPEPAPKPKPKPKPEPAPKPAPKPEPVKRPAPKPEVTPAPKPAPKPKPTPRPEPVKRPAPELKAVPEPAPKPTRRRPERAKFVPPPTATPARKTAGPGMSFLERLEIGTRTTYFFLLEDSRDSGNPFIDSVVKLEAAQDYYPKDAFIQFKLTREFALEICYEEIWAKSISSEDNQSRGIFVMKGPVVSLIGRFPTSTAWQHYFGVGAAIMGGEVKQNPVWHNGFSGSNLKTDYEAWLAAGSPEWPNNGLTRTLEAGDNVAFAVTLGTEYSIDKAWSMDLMVRYIDLKTDTRYYESTRGAITTDHGTKTVPLQHISVGVGLKYDF